MSFCQLYLAATSIKQITSVLLTRMSLYAIAEFYVKLCHTTWLPYCNPISVAPSSLSCSKTRSWKYTHIDLLYFCSKIWLSNIQSTTNSLILYAKIRLSKQETRLRLSIQSCKVALSFAAWQATSEIQIKPFSLCSTEYFALSSNIHSFRISEADFSSHAVAHPFCAVVILWHSMIFVLGQHH